jgi:hypothetical protein
MSYRKQGNNCNYKSGFAETSNTKYINPQSELYKDDCSKMMYYPGTTDNCVVNSLRNTNLPQFNPEAIKNSNPNKEIAGCKSCKII